MHRFHLAAPPVRRRAPGRMLVVVLAWVAVLLASSGIGGAIAGTFAAEPAGAVPPSTASTATPAAPAGPNTATFGIGTANSHRLDGRSALRYLASPGGTTTDHIAVQNYGLKPLTLNLYTIDAVNGADGAVGYLPRGGSRTDAASWLRIPGVSDTGTVTVPARTAKILPVLLSVPLKATPGDHVAGIILSLISKVTGKSGQLVNFEQRVALRASVRVSGDLIARLDVQQLRASFDGSWSPLGRGNVRVEYTVHNSGNVTLAGTQRVRLSGALGRTGSATALVQVPLLLPGGSTTVSMTMHRALAEFLMSATVTVSPLAVPGDADPPLQDGVAAVRFWAVPWVPLGVLVVLLAALPVAVRLIRRRRAGGRHSGPPPRPLVAEKV